MRFARFGKSILQFDGQDFAGLTAIGILDSLLLLGRSAQGNGGHTSQPSATVDKPRQLHSFEEGFRLISSMEGELSGSLMYLIGKGV